MTDPTDNSRRRATVVLNLILAALIAIAGCQAPQGHDPTWSPFKACPAGQARVKDVTRPAGQQWVCE